MLPALPSFHKRYPDLQLDIGVSDRPSDLAGDRIDCVVRVDKVTDPSLIARPLGDFPFAACASRAYLERHGMPTHPSEFEDGHVLVRYFYASGRNLQMKLARDEEQYKVAGKHFIAANDGNALVAAGLTGLGIVHMPAFIARPHIDAGTLIPVLDEWHADPI